MSTSDSLTPRRRGRPRLVVDEAAIIAAYLDGMPILRLAHEHGVDRYVIRRVLDEAGVPRNRCAGCRWYPR